MQTIERDQLFLATKEGDVVTIKTLLNDKYIDVNVIKPREYCEDKWEVTILIACMYVYVSA